MKKSTAITLGVVLAAGVSLACASGEDDSTQKVTENADHQKICVTITDQGQQMERRDDEECSHQPDDNGIGSDGGTFTCLVCWYYLGRAHGSAPAVGQKIPISAVGSFSRPTSGSIASPPKSGGFGTYTSRVVT